MSGGEQQRVALARAIVTDPLMILADEPTGALDTQNAENVMEIFDDLVSPERAIVIVTHDLEVAAGTDRRVSMRDGEIEADVYQTPTGPHSTAALAAPDDTEFSEADFGEEE